jgi:hypothetical protein
VDVNNSDGGSLFDGKWNVMYEIISQISDIKTKMEVEKL